jgi:hypothetical protein
LIVKIFQIVGSEYMAVEGDPVAEKVQIRSFITACLLLSHQRRR